MPRKKAIKKPAKKKKLESLSQIHGKEEKFHPTTLDQIWGDDGLSKYSTMNLDEYKSQIHEMGKTDLMAHASKLSLIPVDNRELLEKRLFQEFKRHVSQYVHPGQPNVSQEGVSSEVKKILSEGR